MRRIAPIVPFLLAVLLAPACSSTPPPVCTALDQNQQPLAAVRIAYGPPDGDRATAAAHARQGAADVRASCPEHEDAARAMESYAGSMGS